MSISSTTAVARFTVPNTWPANPFPMAIFAFDTAGDIAVSDGAKFLTYALDYTVSGGGYNSANQLQTGTVTLLTTSLIPSVGDVLVVYRNQLPEQTTTFSSTGLLTPLMIEQDDDRLTTFDQQILISMYNPFPPAGVIVSGNMLSGTSTPIFLGWITAQTGGITTSIDSLAVNTVPTIQLPLIITVSISGDYEFWKLRPMQVGDPSVSVAGAFIVPVYNPTNLIWARVL